MTEQQAFLLSKSSKVTVSIAVVLAVVGGVFWTGWHAKGLVTRVDYLETRQNEDREESKVWQERTTEILSALRDLTADNKRRIDYVESRQ